MFSAGPTYTTNQAYASIIGSLGGTFSWVSPFTGDLQPVTVLGSYANTNLFAPTLSYYWYSYSGIGDCDMSYMLEQGGGYHGFQYVPTNPAWGSIAATTDQDWVRTTTSTALMQNIITHLINPPSPCVVLNLDELEFKAELVEKGVELSWLTKTEFNSDFFTVEKSIDGVNFEIVGQIKAAGNSSEPLHYKLIDTKPYRGISYYRLKQRNLDGRIFRSEVKVIELEDLSKLNVYPNPVSKVGLLNISYDSNVQGPVIITVQDYLGRKLLEQEFMVFKGLNRLQISVKDLAHGVYFLSLNQDNMGLKVKFIKGS